MKYQLKKNKSYFALNVRKLDSINVFRESYKSNKIYILLRGNDKELRFSLKDSLPFYRSKGFEVIGNKIGTVRELELLKSTFYELKLNSISKALGRNYIDNLLSYLHFLGCTQINKKTRSKKKYIV